MDLNTTNACTAWRYNNFTLPSNVRNIHIAGDLVKLFPIYACMVSVMCYDAVGFQRIQKQFWIVFIYLPVGGIIHGMCL